MLKDEHSHTDNATGRDKIWCCTQTEAKSERNAKVVSCVRSDGRDLNL